MIKELVHDPIFLAQKSTDATIMDLQAAMDLMETLLSYKDTCVGMAANMIGVKKRIICVNNEGIYLTMLNPEIVSSSEPYDAEESCLSLLGGPKKTKRYGKIRVKFQTMDFKEHTQSFEGWTAQIIQHEIDHCNGVLI